MSSQNKFHKQFRTFKHNQENTSFIKNAGDSCPNSTILYTKRVCRGLSARL